MTDTPNGIEAMRTRMARASRKPPQARHPRMPPEARPQPSADAAPATDPAQAPTIRPTGRDAPAAPPDQAGARTGARLAPDLPPVNLAIRVRRPLDDTLVEIIHTLRGRGVRSSKVEIIEMLMWELADDDAGIEDIVARLARFRGFAPRSLSSAIPE